MAAPSGSGMPLVEDMNKALEANPFDRQEDSNPPANPPIYAVVGYMFRSESYPA